MKISSTKDNKYVIVRKSIVKKNKKKEKVCIEYLLEDSKFYKKLREDTLFFDNFEEAENFIYNNKRFYNTKKYTYHVSNTKKKSNNYSIIKEKSIEEWIEEEGKFINRCAGVFKQGCTYTKLCPSAKWNLGSIRYKNILKSESLKCVNCGKEVKIARLEKNLSDKDKNGEFSYHWNFYAEDGTLMTCDHIIPKSKGGTDDDSNLQVMCIDCNFEKADSYECPSFDYDDTYDDEDELEEEY